MSCTQTSSCTCGCCSGTSVQTPVLEQNLPGQKEIAYRAGAWAAFRESMFARLSSADYPALSYLKTRDTDDFSIALLDAGAIVFDILTFYQERLANESYLRTATQLSSLTELARLIGYQPASGVAAETLLAFTLKAATGLPANPHTTAITIPSGTQVQSVPAQGQTPQTFETSADILAKADWNALPITTGIPWTPPVSSGLYLAGTATQLNIGDALLIVGADRDSWTPTSTPNEQWDIVFLNQVKVDQQNNRTWVAWDKPIAHNSGSGSSPSSGWSTAKVFALRQKAALFGATAPSPQLFTLASNTATTSLPSLITINASLWTWNNFNITSASQIDLDSTYPKLAVGSWFILYGPDGAQLFKVTAARELSRSDFAVSGKCTRLSADFNDSHISSASFYPLQGTAVYGQSEELTVAPQPIDHPLYGSVIDIDALRPDLVGVDAIAVFGKAQKLTVISGPLKFVPDDGSDTLPLRAGDTVTLIDPGPLPINGDGSIPDWASSSSKLNLRMADTGGRTGTVNASVTSFSLSHSAKSDPDVQEFALVSSVLATTNPYPHTRILLTNPLSGAYDRAMSTINANVGLATAGRSVSEVVGSGSAATPNQSFLLKQSPLTYTQAATASGRASTLKVTADGIQWKEVQTLYEQSPTARVYSTRNNADNTTNVLFGDGVGNAGEGSTLPTGQNNIQARYRIGSGLAGNVAATSITTLVDRPLGVSGVTNPSAATGGQDPQSITDIRTNAPSSVLTLGRAVSVADYQNYAANFGGIAKAQALWIPSGPGRGVFLTVAGAEGIALPPGSSTLSKLITSLQTYGSPLTPIHAISFLETLFRVAADVAYDPDYDSTAVQAAIVSCLRQRYSFAQRSFGQGVSADEITALIQNVPGVIAVNVTSLTVGDTSRAGDLAAGSWSVYAYHQWLSQMVTLTRPTAPGQVRICPYIPVASLTGLPLPAELLVLDPDPTAIALGVLV